MKNPQVAILHYSAPPIVGGVEAVMLAHARLFHQNNYPTTILAGRGSQEGIGSCAQFIQIPEID